MSGEVENPGLDHSITVEPNSEQIVVRVGDLVIADTASALTLREMSYEPVHYIPLGDVNQNVLMRSSTTTYCPYKGDASYYTIMVQDRDLIDAAWTYEEPYPAVKEIASHVAFYPEHVQFTVDADAG
ncbi:DUF427 domain-containing protein [Streptomyces sp. NPDC056653]|uniref:DUF427 domain-containing protein n=1 Tax=Streptomyces sp. NPDC056653 TaxID=3345894 RepID=UPI0036C40814